VDERKAGRDAHQVGETADGRPGLLRCRDCKAYMLYGPEVCSYCLSERLERVSPDEKGETRSLGPQ
jgi:uncharacterized OB-fold protein